MWQDFKGLTLEGRKTFYIEETPINRARQLGQDRVKLGSCKKSTQGPYVGVVDESGEAGQSQTAEAHEAGGELIWQESRP